MMDLREYSEAEQAYLHQWENTNSPNEITAFQSDTAKALTSVQVHGGIHHVHHTPHPRLLLQQAVPVTKT